VSISRSSDDEEPKKRFRIQRKRLGTVKYINETGEFGFITAEDFREDVFFHRTVWEGPLVERPHPTKDNRGKERRERFNDRQPAASEGLAETLVDTWVEFEIDDDHFANEQKLRATVVRPSDRPQGKKLSGRDATFNIVKHHPKARRKRPSWRDP
jgi:hypothetical protein